MNEVLDDIAKGRLFPSSCYYRAKKNNSKHQNDEDKVIAKPAQSASIWVSDKILKKMDIMQDADINNDEQMFKIMEALDKAHSDLNNITINYFNKTVDQLESCPIIKDPGCIENAKKQVLQCLSEYPDAPLNCSKYIKLFLQSIKNSTCSYKCHVLTNQI